MAEIAIRARGLGKKFNLNVRPHASLKEAAKERLDRLGQNLNALRRDLLAGRVSGGGRAGASQEFWALRDISFELPYGEVLGILGRNGAGKSTLLKIFSQVMAPTEGRAEVYGRIGALLEVGTGFNAELSGRENVFLYGAVLGMDRAAIRRRYDEIVEFSGIEQFIDEPLKHYSSGMRSRLGFSVAVHLECDILLVDEVLSVGDATFTSKCTEKMKEVIGQGRAVIYVGHGLNALSNMCEKGIVLQDGRIGFSGEVNEAIAYYLEREVRPRISHGHDNPAVFPADASKPAQFKSIRLCDEDGGTVDVFRREERVVVACEIVLREPCADYKAHLSLRDEKNNALLQWGDADGAEEKRLKELPPGDYAFRVALPKNLFKMGTYYLSAALDGAEDNSIERHENVLNFMIKSPAADGLAPGRRHKGSLVDPDILWEMDGAARGAAGDGGDAVMGQAGKAGAGDAIMGAAGAEDAAADIADKAGAA